MNPTAFSQEGSFGRYMAQWIETYFSAGGESARLPGARGDALERKARTGGVALDRSQITVDDTAWMNAMIPHHSLAITRSERAQIQDVRVCELAAEISAAQRNEILEMNWLIDDISSNGIAETPEEAQARPAPTFDETALRGCPNE